MCKGKYDTNSMILWDLGIIYPGSCHNSKFFEHFFIIIPSTIQDVSLKHDLNIIYEKNTIILHHLILSWLQYSRIHSIIFWLILQHVDWVILRGHEEPVFQE